MKLFSQNVVLPGPRVASAELTLSGTDIVAVHERAAPSPDAQDLGDRILCPAFVNSHTHLPLIALRGIAGLDGLAGNVVEELYFRFERMLSPEDIHAFATLGALDNLLHGVGTVFEHYYHSLAIAQAMRETGLTSALAPALQDLEGPGVPLREQAFQEIEALLSPEWAQAGIAPVVGPHATDTVSDALFERAIDVAERHSLPIHLHVAQSTDELARSLSTHGVPPMSRLLDQGLLDRGPAWLMVHCLYVGDDELDRLDPARHTLGYCPTAQAQFDFPCPVAAWQDRGLPVALGTDAASCNDTNDVQGELRWLALGEGWSLDTADLRRDLVGQVDAFHVRRQAHHARRSAPGALLRSIWEIPGELHPGLRVGRIQAGYRANLLVIDRDHPSLWPASDVLQALAFNRAPQGIWGMMTNGRWIGQPGDFRASLLAPMRQASAQAQGRLERLLSAL